MSKSIVKDWEKYCKEIEGFYEDDSIPEDWSVYK